jgi:hypothetical protein
MFEEGRQLMEREAYLQGMLATETLRTNRRVSFVHYATFLIAASIAFIFLLVILTVSEVYPAYRSFIRIAGVLLAGIVVLTAEILRSNSRYLQSMGVRSKALSELFKGRWNRDFLFPQFMVSCIILWMPMIIGFILFFTRSNGWIWPGDPEHDQIKNIIHEVMPFTAGLLGAQLTLFTFVLGHFLGRYSSNLASAVVRHKAVMSVVGFAFLGFATLGFDLLFGYPDRFSFWPILVGILTACCLLLTVWITLAGIAADRAIEYAGLYFAKRIRRTIKKPLVHPEKDEGIFWRILTSYGLDFRDPERLVPLVPPPKDQDKAIRFFMGLFNAANKAIQDGQQEVLHSSLRGIHDVAIAYTEKRKHYIGGDDQVFSYINDQMASLIKASAKSPNQHMITDIITGTGFLGRLTLKIGKYPNTINENIEKEQRDNSLVMYWFDLLKEGFEISHTLMRSTAASESINQMEYIAIEALKEGYSEVILYCYLPMLRQIHQICLRQIDAYHTTLSSETLRSLLKVWFYPLLDQKCKVPIYHFHAKALDTLREMALQEIKLNIPLALGFNNVVHILTSKIATDRITLQDIFCMLALRRWKDERERSIIAEEMESLIKLIVDLGAEAISSKQALSKYYGEALYEMGYIVLRGINELSPELQQELEGAIFDAWERLTPLYYENKDTACFDWEHPMFALLGYGMGAYKKRPRDLLKNHLLSCVRLYQQLIQEESKEPSFQISNETMGYLQLVGAWTSYFLNELTLATEIQGFIERNRNHSFPSLSFRSKYCRFGYPTIIDFDFFLPNLNNIGVYLTQTDWKEFADIQASVMSDEVLIPYAQRIKSDG